ncbi:MAG TPA: acetyl-CoA carboxylase biotin carboxyl carrier protein subunit [Anaerolineaceae bacterium]|nr:acetyl-CoA carboxylase biotin carboxyl carrier protein subunit [Anaerolineaceae bacterium]HPN53725.1 acetyl-CoA carboxylase biotin carboxyl carrier protein subunit [Anaerolineaceae bacterium]
MKTTVKIDNQSFDVEIGDLNARPIMVVVDGETFEVWPEETRAAAPAAEAPKAAAAAPRPAAAPAAAPAGPVNKARAVSAPIPGTIISIAVKPGDSVAQGQELCILEAMKMKNTIRAGRAGTIAALHVKEGDSVKHNQALMEFAD